MSIDPRDFDERGLLLQILFSLQSVEGTLQTIAELRSKITDDSAPVEEKEEEPIRTWRLKIPDQGLTVSEEALIKCIVTQYTAPVQATKVIVYAGQKIRDAEEVEPGLS